MRVQYRAAAGVSRLCRRMSDRLDHRMTSDPIETTLERSRLQSQAAAARWAAMTPEERREHTVKAARPRQYQALSRHIDRVAENLTHEQREELAICLAPWLRT